VGAFISGAAALEAPPQPSAQERAGQLPLKWGANPRLLKSGKAPRVALRGSNRFAYPRARPNSVPKVHWDGTDRGCGCVGAGRAFWRSLKPAPAATGIVRAHWPALAPMGGSERTPERSTRPYEESTSASPAAGFSPDLSTRISLWASRRKIRRPRGGIGAVHASHVTRGQRFKWLRGQGMETRGSGPLRRYGGPPESCGQ